MPQSPISLLLGAGALALAAAGVTGQARADDDFARQRFEAMSSYLADQQAFSFNYDSSLDVVTTDGQKLAIASSGSAAMERPGRISASRNGGFAFIDFWFDGTTLTVLNRDDNVYARADVPGDVEHLIDELRDTYKRPLPAADLLLPDVAGALGPLFTDAKDLGSGVIGGVECDHIAFRAGETDLQLWIAQGDAPYPCRYVITTTGVEGMPQYMVDVHDWMSGEAATPVAEADIPADAREVAPNEVPHLDELAGVFVIEGEN